MTQTWTNEPKITDDEVVALIVRLTAERGFPPTVRELCDATTVTSTATMWRRLRRLRRNGVVAWDTQKVRTLRVIA